MTADRWESMNQQRAITRQTDRQTSQPMTTSFPVPASVHPVLHLQRTIGNQGVRRLLESSVNIASGTGVRLARSNGHGSGPPPPPPPLPPVGGLSLGQIENEIIAIRRRMDEVAKILNEGILEPAGTPVAEQPHREGRIARPDLRGRVSRENLVQRLQEVVARGGEGVAEAQAELQEIQQQVARLNELKAERETRQAFSGKKPAAPVTTPSTEASGEGVKGRTDRGRGSSSTSPRPGRLGFPAGGTDITGEEVEARSGVTSGPTLLGMIGEWILQDFSRGQQAKLDAIGTKQINDGIEQQLRALAPITIALQSRGDIAYAQVTVKQTSARISTYGEGITVRELERVWVSEWFRQEKDRSTREGVTEIVSTNSFALALHPIIIEIAAAQLTVQIRNIDAQLQSSASSSGALQQRREQLERCVARLRQKGPHVPSFSFLGGECLDVLPKGTPPPA